MTQHSADNITFIIRLERLWDYWNAKPHTPAVIQSLNELHEHIMQIINNF